MNTITRTGNDIKQTTSSNYVMWSGYNNLKTTDPKTYAVSTNPIKKKSAANGNRPAIISLTDFRAKVPSNAVIKKIEVYYRHSRRAVCKSGNNDTPCGSSNTDNRCNIPAPTISILKTNLSKKGQAPYAKIKQKTYGKLADKVTFSNLNLSADVVNHKDFGIRINYPKNANESTGYVFLNYLYMTISYDTPSFTLSAQNASADKVYNKSEYHLRVNLSDKNLTRKGSNVNISLPSGLSYTGFKGNGKITTVGNSGLIWVPDMRASSASVELVFDVNVSFAQGSSSVNKSFGLTLVATSWTGTHTVTVYKELPPEKQIEDDSDKSHYEDDAKEPTNKIVEIVQGEDVDYTFTLDEGQFDALIDEIYDYGNDRGWWNGITDKRQYIINNTSLQFSGHSGGASTYGRITYNGGSIAQRVGMSYLKENGGVTLPIRGEEKGYDEIELSLYGTYSNNHQYQERLSNLWKFDIIPSPLTYPNFIILQPSEEECNRLGTGYGYTVQSNLSLTSEETYMRDWYKNYRIGVYNNPIYSNITSYYQYDNTEENFDGYFTLPPIYDLDGASLTVTTDHSIILDEETVTTSKTYTDLTDYNIPVNFQKVSDDNVILTMTLTTQDNTTWSKDLHINFNAEEDTNIQEITTDTTDYDNLTNQQIIENAEYWATETAGLNTTNIVECPFTYNKNYPLYILITGDYPESDYYASNTLSFTEPTIVETTVYEPNKPNGNYPTPIDDLILQDTSSSEITLNPYTTAETIVFYNLPLDDHYGTDTEKAIRGIELVGEIQQADTLVLSAKLKSPKGDSRERSIVINEEALTDGVNSFSMGGNGDLWGFNTLDIVEFEDWEVEFTINNSLEETDSSINFGNIKLILYIEQVDQQTIKSYIDGQDISFYGVFLTDVKIPEGLETDTAYLSVDGTDINDAYRQNIREKEIQIEFDIGDGCSLEAATLSLREFAKLLVNDRDEYNRPIPKRIEFSHYPDVYWEYVMEKGLESEIDINTYQVKAKLTVPAGTSYDKVNTTTSNTGYVNGLASINPTLIVKPTSETITIRETISGQEFHIGYTGGWDDKILEIDCENRICWMKTSEEDTDPVNLNRYIDYNSDWFVLKEDYAFEGVNCVIRTVDYAERW